MDFVRFIETKLREAVKTAVEHGLKSREFDDLTDSVIEDFYEKWSRDFCNMEPHVMPINPGAEFVGDEGSRFILFTANDSKVYVLVTDFNKCFPESDCEFGILQWDSAREFVSNMKRTKTKEIFRVPNLSLKTLKELYSTEYEKLSEQFCKDLDRASAELEQKEKAKALEKAIGRLKELSDGQQLCPGCHDKNCRKTPIDFVSKQCERYERLKDLPQKDRKKWRDSVFAFLNSDEMAEAKKAGVELSEMEELW